MKQYILIFFYVILAAIGIIKGCSAGEFKLLEVDKFHMEATKPVGTNRIWVAPKTETKQGDLNLRFDLVDPDRFFFWRQRVDSFYTERQFRYIGLTEELALEPFHNGLEFYIAHKSEHFLDYEPEMKYPNSNLIGIRLKFID